MQYIVPALFIISAALIIEGRYVAGSICLAVFIIVLIWPYALRLISTNKKLAALKAESMLPKLTESFHTYGRGMADYDMYTASGSRYGWVMPGNKAIQLVEQFIRIGRPDIPINMLCEGVEQEFKVYDRRAGMTPILDQAMEARLRLLSALAQTTNSDLLKGKISGYIIDAKSRGVNLRESILTDPLPDYML